MIIRCDDNFVTFVLLNSTIILNYLAHILLSGNDPQVKIGNFIGDFVKGSRLNEYPPKIRQGIVLHRKIDEFTDSHPVVRETVNFIRPSFGRYSGVIADMYFDYFLAINFCSYSSESLNVFAFRFYFLVIVNYKHLPVRVQGFIFHFISANRLKKYASIDGLKDSLQIMANYKSSAIEPDKTIQFLLENSDEIEKRFHSFFPDLIEFARRESVK